MKELFKSPVNLDRSQKLKLILFWFFKKSFIRKKSQKGKVKTLSGQRLAL